MKFGIVLVQHNLLTYEKNSKKFKLQIHRAQKAYMIIFILIGMAVSVRQIVDIILLMDH